MGDVLAPPPVSSLPCQEWQTAQRQAEKAKQTSQDQFGSPASGSRTGYPTNHASASPTLHLCGFISASGRSLEDLSALGRKIWQIANDSSLFPDIHQPVPKSWRRVWAVMDALREGADPEKAVKAVRLDGPLAPVEGHKHEFVTREAAFEAWWRADGESVAELKAKGPDSQQLYDLFQVRWGVIEVPKSSFRAHRGVRVWIFRRQVCQNHT